MDGDWERHLLAASPDGLWLIDLAGKTLYVNDRASALLGRTPDEIATMSIFDVTDEQGGRDLEQHLAAMGDGDHEEHNAEVFLLRPDGTGLWTLVSWAPAYDDDGRLLGYLHRLTEFTDRRELVERLSRRERELESAQAIAHIGSWTYDVVARRSSWSPELFRIHGLEPADRCPELEDYLGLLHPDDVGHVMEVMTTALPDARTYGYEARVVTPDGEVRWIKADAVIDRDDDGAPLAVHGTSQDITDLQRAADDATQARRRLALFSSIADAANRSDDLDVALGRAWAALESVDEWRSLAVWTRADPRSSPELLHDLTGPDDPPLDAAAVAAVAEVPSWRDGEVAVGGTPVPGRRTVWLPVSLGGHVRRLIQLEGRVDQVDDAILGLLVQVSATLGRVAEREQAAVELAAARDDAMAASAHKSAFLATMSHEIRTPMNGVIGLNDLLLKTELDPQQRRLAEGLRGAGLTLLALINDILDLSKIESGAVELERAPFEVSDVLDQTATIITPPAQEKQLELVLGCDAAVPATLVGDRVRLGQVLTNLASNAVKFTEHGEVVVRLGLTGSPQPGRVLLRGEVRDTGIGIGPDASALFEAFTQADRSTTRSHGGTGLGLTISRRLVQDMGGSIGAEERPGGGSTFWFVVPMDLAPDDAATPARPQLPRRRVLVVDDNESAAATLAHQLDDWGLDVAVAGSAEAALATLREAATTTAPFEVALVDLHMPGTDGLRLGRRIAEHGELAALALILLSDDPSTRGEHVRQLGFRHLVDKPVRASELYDALSTVALDTDELLLAEAEAEAPEPPLPGRERHVLVVEDNPVNQLVAQGILGGLGCRSTLAANGEEAVAALTSGHDFDLVLMDCRMPRMDGYEATRRIRQQEGPGARVPIIAMTASALAGERDRCLAVGMDDFLTKPVDPVALTRVVTRWATAGQAGPADRSTSAAGGAARASRPPSEQLGQPEPPVLDPERVAVLGELVRDGVSFFERTRTSYLTRIDDLLLSLRTALEQDDLERVVAVAHQLKGSALNLGLARTGTAAGRVESAATERDHAAVGRALATLEAAVTEGVQALADVRAADHAPPS